ncbi:hypothetical protein ACNPEZ_28535, partial [Klebsiella pneumoniae]
RDLILQLSKSSIYSTKSTASTICHIAFASTGITIPSDEQAFFHLSDSIHNRLGDAANLLI